MKIKRVVCSAGRTGFYFDDQKAIKAGAKNDGLVYVGEPVTDGFKSIRVAGESISIMIELEDGQMAYGDCAAVQYSGAGGRDPLFLASDFIPVIDRLIKPELEGCEITTFKEMATKFDKMTDENGKQLHTAIRYGVTQAILDAVAKANKVLMAEVVANEYNQTLATKNVPIFTQSGDDRYLNADKMILKGADVLPHALINTIEKLDGLPEYVKWLSSRIQEIRVDESYHPTFHLDVYGTMGMKFGSDFEAIANLIVEVEKNASPFDVRIEGPVDAGNREDTMIALREIRKLLEAKGSKALLVADEWCNTYEDVVYFADNKAGHWAQIKTPDLGGINNTIEAVIYCKEHDFGAYVGGTCNETERSAQVCTHVCMAMTPDQQLAKPGMGVDEGFMIVYNEQNRILAYTKR